MLTDLALREFLMGGLGLHAHNYSQYDLRYELLPRSLDGVLQLIVRIRDTNARLPQEPPSPGVFPVGFLSWIENRSPKILEELGRLEKQYMQEEMPEALAPWERSPPVYSTEVWPPENPRRVSSVWLSLAASIDDAWVKSARRLNRARNLAAHSVDRPAIAAALGFSGPDVQEQVRESLVVLISELLGVLRNEPG